ncbi:DEAD/DEAH box helicase [Xanthovirga aplysinae]|uniref:DEAD/DEAH box helicase n=1 Tax=Xanthovirga aplysinae TaxID=2529853 RepID=UPI0012BD78A7|nr:DEAD/DEAH box helicase [Xanthovirga aplysinae]MTI32753.1 DEAD/DEAH box helicase [Xanthovirga aplysinae]
MNTFEELGISKALIKGLKELNIVQPTEIQSEVIPLLLNNKTDLVGQAQTGTGKTAAFGLPLLERIEPKRKVVQGLILCPTRELGQQVAKQLFKFTKYTDKIFTEAVYGGEKIDRQINALSRPTHIIVATPGRLIDLVKRKAVDLSQVKTVILDEADEMLSMGFKKELDQILGFLSNAESKWLFSATIPHGIRHIINKHMSADAHRVEISGRNVVNKNIAHQYLICEEVDKFHVLMQFLKSESKSRGVVFCKTKAATQKLEKQLAAKNVAAGAIHGDLLQKERDKVMRAFKNKKLQFLISTDIAARGIHIDELSFVVHYQLPDKEEYYTHRSGRTARAGKEGISLSLVSTSEIKQLRYFEKVLGISFNQIRQVK